MRGHWRRFGHQLGLAKGLQDEVSLLARQRTVAVEDSASDGGADEDQEATIKFARQVKRPNETQAQWLMRLQKEEGIDLIPKQNVNRKSFKMD
jgi:hypothetical protein